MHLFIDVDGTLIDKDDSIRPFVKELFETAHAKGFFIFVWSAGGVAYAKLQLERIYYKLGMSTPVSIIPKDFSYVRFKDFRSMCIDDIQEVCDSFLKWGSHAKKVPYYESTIHLQDTTLKLIAESL